MDDPCVPTPGAKATEELESIARVGVHHPEFGDRLKKAIDKYEEEHSYNRTPSEVSKYSGND